MQRFEEHICHCINSVGRRSKRREVRRPANANDFFSLRGMRLLKIDAKKHCFISIIPKKDLFIVMLLVISFQ